MFQSLSVSALLLYYLMIGEGRFGNHISKRNLVHCVVFFYFKLHTVYFRSAYSLMNNMDSSFGKLLLLIFFPFCTFKLEELMRIGMNETIAENYGYTSSATTAVDTLQENVRKTIYYLLYFFKITILLKINHIPLRNVGNMDYSINTLFWLPLFSLLLFYSR